MIKGMFEYIIVGALDREKLTCEIRYKNEVLAEINQETDELRVEIFESTTRYWEIPLEDFQDALETGRKFLLCEK